MRGLAISAIVLMLGGCASEPMTAEQRQFAMQYLLSQQANKPPPPQPYYVPIAPAPQQRQTNCITNQVGGTLYTNCNKIG